MDQERIEQYELVKKAAAGDNDAFTELYNRKARSILLQSVQLMGNWHDGEELSQNIVIIMYKGIHKLRDPGLFNAWMNSIISNQGKKMMKNKYKQKNQVAIEDHEDDLVEDNRKFLPAEYAENEEMREFIFDIIDGLPAGRKRAITLYYYEELSYAEIADVMGVTEGTVKKALSEGKKAIKKQLEKRTGRKLHTHYLLSAAPTVPTMKRIFELEIEKVISDEKVHSFLSSCSKIVAAQAPIGSISANKASGGKFLGAKIAAMVAVGTTVITAGVLANANPDQVVVETPAHMDAAIIPQPGGGDDSHPFEPSVGEEDDGEVEPGIPEASAGSPEVRSETVRTYQPVPEEGAKKLTTSVTGKVFSLNNEGHTLTTSKYISSVEIRLLDASGNLLDRTTTDASGNYSVAARLSGSGSYRITMILPEGKNLIAAGDTPDGSKSIQLTAGQIASNVHLYLKSVEVPGTSIYFWDGDCDCGHVNPRKIAVEAKSRDDVTVSWRIIHEMSGEVVHSGTGSIIQKELQQLYQSGAAGSYVLECTAVNETGNKGVIKKSVWIDRGEIDPGQYQ